MHSPCIREASEACFHGCCPNPFLGLPDKPRSSTTKPIGSVASFRYEFTTATTSSLYPSIQFTNHESLPSLPESYYNFTKAYPQYTPTDRADWIRTKEYYHLSLYNHVCFDYIGHGLFSYSQLQSHCPTDPIAPSSSSSPPPPPSHSDSLKLPFFDISHKSVNFYSQIVYGGVESELESKIRKRIMGFLNISEAEYSMVFTANQPSAFKLVADSYPFKSNRNLLTVYDYENEAVGKMIESSMKGGARNMSAEFSWPNLRIQSRKLRNMVVCKGAKKKRGLFVFPLQSRMTGVRYSYQWMNLAQENGWHILLDASALGPKDMDTLGLSLFRPDFLICSFYKVFGENPSGFGCLFVKKSSASILKDSATAISIGIVSLLPSQFPEQTGVADIETKQTSDSESQKDDLAVPSSLSGSVPLRQMSKKPTGLRETEEVDVKKKGPLLSSEIEELDEPIESSQSKITETSISGRTEIEFRGLDHADSLGLMLISSRARYLINWLVNALMSLQHPHSENGVPLVRIYGPKIKFDRGPAVAFNVFDWKGEKVDPTLVQKLADRNNISLSYGFLHHIWFSDKYEEEREKILEKRATEVEEETVGIKKKDKFQSGISVVTAALGFLNNFEDTYRLWAFVSRFLDADFVEKERWRYTAINQKTVEV